MNLRARLGMAGFKAVKSDRSNISFFLTRSLIWLVSEKL